MKSFFALIVGFSLLASFANAEDLRLAPEDLTKLGGDLSNDFPSIAILQLVSPNIQSPKRENEHFLGNTAFHQSQDLPDTEPEDLKVGPLFNASTCGGCHVNDGQGPLSFEKSPKESAMLLKVSLKGLGKNGAPKDVPKIGEQLQDHSIDGTAKYNLKMSYMFTTDSYPDGTTYELRKPVVSFSIPGVKSSSVVTSLRRTPPVIGMGLLEAVPAETIKAMSDPNDLDNDGVSGKVNYVLDVEKKAVTIGRFGFRATHPTLRQQSAAAAFHDMGVTNTIFRDGKKKVELSSKDLRNLVLYLQVSSVPVARDQDKPDVIAGKALFKKIGCDACHKMTLKTGKSSSVPEVANQTFHPFTDLLLHNMGPGLADKRAEFSASGSEWRTTPLWGIGLTETLSANVPNFVHGFLHDGRARTLEEAILWHDGEGKRSRSHFKSLSADERQQLITFLNSL